MINSNEHIADRPIRNHFNAIVLSGLAAIAVILVLAILFFHFKRMKTEGVSPTKVQSVRPTQAR
jgi:hypothetical protein